MDDALLNDAATQYSEQGFCGPIKAFEPAGLDGVAQRVVNEIAASTDAFQAKRNRHHDWPVIGDLIGPSPMISLAKRILGPELVLWRTHLFLANTGEGLRWHQDEYGALLADTTSQMSIHLALSEAPPDNCVAILPRSHRMKADDLERFGFNHIPALGVGGGNSVYWRSAEAQVNVVKMVLQPGEFFCFHPRLLHASLDDTTPPGVQPIPPGKKPSGPGLTRVGIAFRFTRPDNTVLPAAFDGAASNGDRGIRL